MPEASKERLIRYLNDAHAAVQGEISTLTDVNNQSLDDAVTAATQKHLDTAKSHLGLLEERIEALGGKRAGAKGFLNTVIAKGSNFVNAFHDDQDKQTQDLIKLFALEKFGVGMFTSLHAFADAASDMDTAQAADTFENLIPQLAVASVNTTSDVTVTTSE
jgi:ferritin-like metal-binding protein YciE